MHYSSFTLLLIFLHLNNLLKFYGKNKNSSGFAIL